MFGALGVVLIAVGLILPYVDIYKERRVRGFSFIFLMIDMGGALFSLLSLCIILFFQLMLTSTVFETFDPLAAVLYIVQLENSGISHHRSCLSWKPGSFFVIGTFASSHIGASDREQELSRTWVGPIRQKMKKEWRRSQGHVIEMFH